MADEEKIDLSLFLNEYLEDAKAGFQRANSALLALEKDHSQSERLEEIARVFHTLKSSSAMLGFDGIADLSHFSENLLGRMRKNEISVTKEAVDTLFEVIDLLEAMVRVREERKEPGEISAVRYMELKKKLEVLDMASEESGGAGQEEKIEQKADAGSPDHSSYKELPLPAIEKIETVRVRVSLLDTLFNLVGELLITKNRIDNILAGTANKELKAALSSMDHMITSMQENVSTARLVQVDEIFQKFPRMVRDLARAGEKDIDFIIEGRDIELDKSVLDAISEPLLHLLRNAVGHGIESMEERQQHGKNTRGTIRLEAKRDENHILIDVSDDGRGIDLELMKGIAVRKGFIKQEEAELLKDREVMKILFAPGFSSVEKVTGLSGRGVGLNVVRTAAREMGGTVEVTTEKGKGSRFSLTLPLTTAIMNTLVVGIGGHVFVIPSDIVIETQRVEQADLKEIADGLVFVLKNEIIPFVALGKAMGITLGEEKEFTTVIIRRGDRVLGLGVDEVLDQMDNIVKPFDPIAQKFRGFSGGTILGDGRVALLLDIPTLFGFEILQEEKYLI